MAQDLTPSIETRRRGGWRVALVAAACAAWLLGPTATRADETTPPAAPAAPAAGAKTAAGDDPVVAERGDVKLRVSDVRQMIRYADPEQRHLMQTHPQVLMQQVRDRLLKLSLLEEARASGWDKREDVAYKVKLAEQETIESTWIAAQVAGDPSFPTDAQVQAAYEANKSKLLVPRQYHLAQIFLALPANASKQADEAAQRKLADLRQQVLKQHADFASLAKRYSEEKQTAVNGGDLGWVREEALVPSIRLAVQGLAEGAVSEPIRSPVGWHLVKLIGVKQPKQATLAEARDTLVKAMRQERLVEGQRNYLANMLKQQPIEVNEIELSKFESKP